MLDAFGIINMGGRIAKAKAVERFAAGKKCRCCAVLRDAELGRVLQADPFVQEPTNSQSYNRYTYVFNNPLSFTDPSGFITLKHVLGFVAGIVVGVFLGPWATTLWRAFWVGFATGFITSAIITGSLKSAIKAGVIAGALAGIGFAVGDNAGASTADPGSATPGGEGEFISSNGFETSQQFANNMPSASGEGLAQSSISSGNSAGASIGSGIEAGVQNLDDAFGSVTSTGSSISSMSIWDSIRTIWDSFWSDSLRISLGTGTAAGVTYELFTTVPKDQLRWQDRFRNDPVVYGAVQTAGLLSMANFITKAAFQAVKSGVKNGFQYAKGKVQGLFKKIAIKKELKGINSKSVLEGMSNNNLKHSVRHFDDFKALDSTITHDKLRRIGADLVKPDNLISEIGAKQKAFQSIMNIGGKNVTVRTVLNRLDKLHSIHIRY